MGQPVPRVAAIHDLSGFGRTSLTVVIPVLSSMGAQVCPLPTAVLSTHTVQFSDYTFLDLGSELPGMLDHWRRLDLRFDAVYSGFLASPAQMDIVERCIREHLEPGGLAVIDPVLGDNGKLDPTMTPEMVERMRWLITRADVITPNFTEAAFLLDEPCRDKISPKELSGWIRRLCDFGPRVVVITSVPLADRPGYSAVFAGQRDNAHIWKVECPFIPAHYPGTGDAFASVLLGSLLQGDSVPFSVDRAVQFVTLGIRATFGHNSPPREGIMLERILDTLRAPVTANTYVVLEEDQ